MSKALDDVLQRLEVHVQQPGFIHAIAAIASDDLFIDRNKLTEVDWSKRLSYQELSFITGLMIKKELSTDIPSQTIIESYVKDARALVDELHQVYSSEMMSTMMAKRKEATNLSEQEFSKVTREIFTSKSALVESVFYADSGSYDFQYVKLAPELYQYDTDWLEQHKIDLVKNGQLFDTMKNLSMSARHIFTHPKLKPGEMTLLDVFTFSKPMLLIVAQQLYPKSNIDMEDVSNFLDIYACTPQDQDPNLHAPGEMNIVNLKPIIEIAPDTYFSPVDFNVAEALYESPAHWMRKDDSYRDIAGKHRGDTLEQIVYERFKKIYGEEFAFQSVKIVKGKNTLTDIDVVGIIGSKAIVVQAKGKGMTVGARAGLDERIRSDFQAAIQHGYNQGITSRDVILGEDDYKFIDKDGNEIKLPTGIDEVYIMCVTADVYPAVIHQLDMYLEKDPDQPWPIALSLFDLDLIADYLPDPYDFTFYVKQRIELTEIAKADGEISLLGYHLTQGLFKPDKADRILVARDFAQLIDADYLYKNGKSDKPKAKNSLHGPWDSKPFIQLLDELKTNISDPKLTDIVFSLMTIPSHIREGVIKAILSTRQRSLKDGLPHNFNGEIGESGDEWHSGFSYMSAPSIEVLRERLPVLVRINQYKAKTDTWLGIGAITDKEHLANAVLFSWRPWEQSDEIETATEHYNKFSTKRSVRLNMENVQHSTLKKKNTKRTNRKNERKNKRAGRKGNKN